MKGFSIAQLLIVLGIIAIVSAVTFPALFDYINNLELKNATKEVVINLKLAQQLAITEQIKHVLSFEMLSENYYLIKREDPDVILDSFNLPEGIFFSSITGLTDNEVIYNAGGSVDRKSVV